MTTVLERPSVDVDPDVLAFYTEGCDEGSRLTSTIRGRLEAIRIRELLTAHLPVPGGRVADVGGGPGVHARWLQAAGPGLPCWTRSHVTFSPHAMQASARLSWEMPGRCLGVTRRSTWCC